MIYKSLLMLGRQPMIGRAELESVLGAGHLEPVGEFAIASDVPPEAVPFKRLGGSIRLARFVGVVPTTAWPEIARYAAEQLPALLGTLPPEGKIKLGLSAFGLPLRPDQLLRAGLELKKACKKAGRSVRIVPNSEVALNSAQVLHNQLTGSLGVELLFTAGAKQTFVAQTVAVQDIEAYARRDQGRPKRDARVGMLPPKLAQTIVNLATSEADPSHDQIVLDPFCGTGVVLQEATLMGFDVYGSDIDPRMVEYSDKNLMWLLDQPDCPVSRPAAAQGDPNWRYFRLEAGDATDHVWAPAPTFIACETYLGRPLSAWPAGPEKLREIIGTCNVIIERFLKNIGSQIPSGTRLCLAVPAWRAPNGRMHHLPLLDHLGVLGYNRVSFSWAQDAEMVYYRPDQLVARELLVITRK